MFEFWRHIPPPCIMWWIYPLKNKLRNKEKDIKGKNHKKPKNVLTLIRWKIHVMIFLFKYISSQINVFIHIKIRNLIYFLTNKRFPEFIAQTICQHLTWLLFMITCACCNPIIDMINYCWQNLWVTLVDVFRIITLC